MSMVTRFSSDRVPPKFYQPRCILPDVDGTARVPSIRSNNESENNSGSNFLGEYSLIFSVSNIG